MSQFDSKSLADLKKLCRIECSAEEDADIIASLSRVLTYIEQLDEIDTKNVPTCNYVLKAMLKTVMREDVVGDLLSREQFLANAPDQIGGMIRTPPVLKAPP